MTSVQAVRDRLEIEALRREFTAAGMARDYDRFAALFVPDGIWLIPHANITFGSRAEIRAGIERLRSTWEYLVQDAHPGTIRVDGDTAVGRAEVAEFERRHDGTSRRGHSLYHDRYRRTPDGWRFAARLCEVRYPDATPLAAPVS